MLILLAWPLSIVLVGFAVRALFTGVLPLHSRGRIMLVRRVQAPVFFYTMLGMYLSVGVMVWLIFSGYFMRLIQMSV